MQYRDDAYQPREAGGKRKKLAGYLRAANDLRQSYTAQFSASRDFASENDDTPSIFPGADVVRSGDEEMIIFPSYATRHIKTKPQAQPGTIQQVGGTGRDIRDTAGAGDAEFWKSQWEEYENDKAIVDVDVRGWLYTPHKGQLSRKHRLMVGLARQLVGIPAPSGKSSPASSRPSSRSTSPAGSHRASNSRQDDEFVQQQADEILRKGESEAEIAARGGFSERPTRDSNGSRSRDLSPVPTSRGGSTFDDFLTPSTTNTSEPEHFDPIQKRSSWPVPGRMNAAELVTANNHLMARLRPFMANPSANISVSAFFYNDKLSRQRTVTTNSAGQFHLRAALDFVPTHVRVLASETMSATEEVHVTAARGVSVISDIDDTIKHSAITSGAREIFRNAFIRELGDLTITGVKEWYNKLADMGVKLHYVSNSPWQLYPVLTSFFKLSGLPLGSFHLKQYSGMLQGIFEPVAERKKATLDRIFRDFPERKFVLIGDSGEADLEVYTDVVLEYPGRVIGIFIRDVTTSQNKGGFFDSSMGPLSGERSPKGHFRNMSSESLTGAKRFTRPGDIKNDEEDLRKAIAESLKDMEAEAAADRRSIFRGEDVAQTRMPEARPDLPPRRPTDPPAPQASALEENLIDFSDDDSTSPAAITHHRANSTSTMGNPLVRTQTQSSERRGTPPPPTRPKPAALRTLSNEAKATSISITVAKSSPPKPRKPSTSVNNTTTPSPLSHAIGESPVSKSAPPLPRRGHTYLNNAKSKLSPTSAYFGGSSKKNSTFPTEKNNSSSTQPRAMSTATTRSLEELKPAQAGRPKPPSPRRNLSSYPAAAAQYASNRISGAWGEGELDANAAPLGKKEELWKRRWAKAKVLMEREGVVLRTWRIGTDAMDVCVELVRQELKEMEQKERKELETQELKNKQQQQNKKNQGGNNGNNGQRGNHDSSLI